MHIEFCAKLNFLEGKYAIARNIGFLLSWVGNLCRYLVLRPCKIRTDFVDALLAQSTAGSAAFSAIDEGFRTMFRTTASRS